MTQQTKIDQSEATTAGLRTFDANALIGDTGRALIDLNGQVYTLRITRLGKLILTK